MRTLVTFRSDAFNTSRTKEHFINPHNYGDDVARWLISKLSARGLRVDAEPGQDDSGWYFNFDAGGEDHCFVLGYRPGEGEGELWVGWVERVTGLLGSILGRRRKNIRREAVSTIHEVLAASTEVSAIRWHEQVDFDAGREDLAAPTPGG